MNRVLWTGVIVMAGATGGCQSWFGSNTAPQMIPAAEPVVTAPAPPETSTPNLPPMGVDAAVGMPVKGTLPVPGGTPAVYDEARVTRDPNRFSVVIATYSKSENAQAAAKFLADRGVAVSVGTTTKNLLQVVSYDTFASVKDAEPLRAKIVEIGKDFPEGKPGGKAPWSDAYVTKLKK